MLLKDGNRRLEHERSRSSHGGFTSVMDASLACVILEMMTQGPRFRRVKNGWRISTSA